MAAHETDPERYHRLPTAPTPVRVESGPSLSESGFVAEDSEWTPSDATTTGTAVVAAEPRLGPWALLSAIVALFASLVVERGIPVAASPAIAATMTRRPRDGSRPAGVWALVLGGLATLYSAGWLVWAAFRFGWFG